MSRKGRAAFILAYLSPAVLLYSVFVVWPLIQSFTLSLTNSRGLSQNHKFLRLQNYERLTKDAAYLTAIKNNFWILIFGGLALLIIGIVVAHAVNQEGKFARVLRATYLFPHVLSLVLVATLWTFSYNPSIGLIPKTMSAAGMSPPDSGFLGDLGTALPAVAIAFIWYAVGFYIMLFSAGLKNIPADVVEAAELDGAVGFRRFSKVTWPMLWSVRKVAVTYIVITVINIFALVQVMTQGGNPDRRTEVMLSYFYEKAFEEGKYGYGSSIAISNIALAMAAALVLMFLFRKNPEGRV